MFTGEERPSKAARKSGRSTSPRAVELRRLQNRISQRNHRQRIRETNQGNNKTREDANDDPTSEAHHENHQAATNTNPNPNDTLKPSHIPHNNASVDTSSINSIGDIDPEVFASSFPGSPSTIPLAGMMINDPFMANQLLSQQDSSWSNVYPIVSMPLANESCISQLGYTPQSCPCNGTTGPCPGHLEKMRAQVLAERTSPRPLHHRHQNHHVSNPEMSIPPQTHQTPHHRSSFSRSSDSGSQPLHVDHGNKRMRPSTQYPLAIPLNGASTTSIGDMISSPTDPLPYPASGTSVTEITRRFGIVLEAVRTAGFQDFDAMAAAYYTAQFEKGSLPAMVQCASRSRRLKAMLQELHVSSRQWPRWESRGLNESISETTASLCVEEMERLSKTKEPNPHQGELASLTSSLEWLISDHGGSIRSDHTMQSGTPDELQLLGEMEGAPDSMPYLWSILTELAGAQGVYCDRIARVVVAVLLYARRAQ